MNDVIFHWGYELHMAFETLCQRLCYVLVVALPKGIADFVVYCYASVFRFRAVLMLMGSCNSICFEALEPSQGEL